MLTALALQRRGARVTLYCADQQPAQGASGNRQGALYPLLNDRHDAPSRFFAAAFAFARRQYDELAAQGVVFEHQWCGVSQLAYDEKRPQDCAGFTRRVAAGTGFRRYGAAAKKVNGLMLGAGGVTYPDGGWLCPAELTASALKLARRQGLAVHVSTKVSALEQTGSGWRLTLDNQRQADHAALILANGHQLSDWNQTQHLPCYAVRGQVSHIPTTLSCGG